MRVRSTILALTAALLLVTAQGAAAGTATPGAPGIGDPYFPLDGNGGYNVNHYDLDLKYTPDTDVLEGVAKITARATQDLSTFNLDFEGMTIRSITVDGRKASYFRKRGELTVKPKAPISEGDKFVTVITYDGVPRTIGDAEIGLSGFIPTDDGTLVAGQPDGAATWFPVNDHPLDKATYRYRITVPEGLEAIANGKLKKQTTADGWTTWVWDETEPMASYLATATIGEFDIDAFKRGGIQYYNALDPDLFVKPGPRTGDQFAISQQAQPAYKRLTHTISVPAGGGQLSFWIARDTEFAWDFVFVEVHTVGQDDWTTLPDLNGHTSDFTGRSCPYWLGLHPFLAHYQTGNGDDTCSPTGTTGTWNAATGTSDGYEQWAVDLGAYAGKDVEVSITQASDDLVQWRGAFVDDVAGPGGQGTTSFEDDGDTFDGWTTPGAPEGSAPNDNDWIAGTLADTPPSAGEIAQASLARQPEIIKFLEGFFGHYPFASAGGLVDDLEGLGFALEIQTRPIYSKDFFHDQESGDSVVVHETAHQWTGDDLALGRWQDIWLNEGFATYTEWLWSEHEGGATPQEIFEFLSGIPADDGFWGLTIGDPGPDHLVDGPVYDRGAMTLQALRNRIGDKQFFSLIRQWIKLNRRGNVTTPDFIALAEQVSKQDLDEFFQVWLYTPTKPAELEGPPTAAAQLRAPAAAGPAPRREGLKR
jgi:hypothetical protein